MDRLEHGTAHKWGIFAASAKIGKSAEIGRIQIHYDGSAILVNQYHGPIVMNLDSADFSGFSDFGSGCKIVSRARLLCSSLASLSHLSNYIESNLRSRSDEIGTS